MFWKLFSIIFFFFLISFHSRNLIPVKSTSFGQPRNWIPVNFKHELMIHWRLSTISKTSNESVWSIVYWYVKLYILWKFIQHNAHWDKTYMLEKNPSDKMNVTNNTVFLLSLAPKLIIVLLLICDSYMSWSARFISLKVSVGCSVFDSATFLLKFIFLIKEKYGFFDFKTS